MQNQKNYSFDLSSIHSHSMPLQNGLWFSYKRLSHRIIITIYNIFNTFPIHGIERSHGELILLGN